MVRGHLADEISESYFASGIFLEVAYLLPGLQILKVCIARTNDVKIEFNVFGT